MNYLRLYKNIYDPSILVLYKGNITFELISNILTILEESVENLEDNRQVKKKFNNTTIESFQNLGHHASKSNYISNSELLMVISRKYFYKIVTGNLIYAKEEKEIAKQIEEINNMTEEELRAYYKRKMVEDDFSDKGTAGLGFIDIARKSGQKLVSKFYKINDEYSFFTFEIKVKKMRKKESKREVA